MKILVTGVAGQLGHDVMNELASRGHEGIGSDLAPEYNGIADETYVTKAAYVSMDITNRASVAETLLKINPDAVIHCAAWTAVDAAEDDANKDKVYNVNATGTENIAAVCKDLDCKMMYISTDYVFNGEGTRPWEPDDHREPLNIYGLTKYEGEVYIERLVKKFFTVRIAWVFGVNGKNFIKTMLTVGKNHDKLTVVNDQIGTPTYTFDLARLLIDMAESEKYG